MKRFQARRRVPYSAEQMYALVADVERYPEFLPLCEGLRVTSRRDLDAGLTVLTADMTMGYKAFRETISSRVTLAPDLPRVDVTYLNGPFSHMENRWLFKPLPDGGCEVDFYIGYQLRSPLLRLVVSQVFDRAFSKFASAFEARARTVYGRPERRPTAAISKPAEA